MLDYNWLKRTIEDEKVVESHSSKEITVSFKEAKEGGTVYVTGDSGFCYSSYQKVSEITTKYDEDTGKPYNVLHVNGQRFDGRTGFAIDPPTAYYIK